MGTGVETGLEALSPTIPWDFVSPLTISDAPHVVVDVIAANTAPIASGAILVTGLSPLQPPGTRSAWRTRSGR